MHELETNRLEGKFGGIGVRIGRDAMNNYILYPYPDGPASLAGIEEGDRLISVDHLHVTPETSTENIQAALRGPIGQRVKITIGRSPHYLPQEFEITRAEISLPSVSWHLDVTEPKMGIIGVNLIAASTAKEIEKAITDMRNRGAVAYVLDLRDNSGGLLTAGVDVARLFLVEGTVMQQQYRGKDVETYSVELPGPYADIPLAVLINGNTASASEIIAGALQSNHRAKLIGTPTYGKDTIQLIFELQDGSSMHITAARWWVPGLEGKISEHGLQPDILIDPQTNSENVDQAIQAAIRLLLGSG
jgi:carboxyl-terminal processing protease